MTEKTALEIGIYVAIVAFLLTIIALIDTVTRDTTLNGVSSVDQTYIQQIDS